jgi:LmbE family N-acetylglucosaminyl deacetylase
MSNILFLSPHPDDVELGCGATIARLTDEGHTIYVAVFSDCKKSLPVTLSNNNDDILKENLNSLSYLGVKKDNIFYFNYEVREFNFSRQNILENLISLKKNINPEIIFIPSTNDKHQDHEVISNEAIRCFKNTCTIYGYQLLWNINAMFTNCIFEINKKSLLKKVNALKYYKTQQGKLYFSEDYIKSTAKIQGLNTTHGYAEAFELIYLKNKIEVS